MTLNEALCGKLVFMTLCRQTWRHGAYTASFNTALHNKRHKKRLIFKSFI